MKNTSYQKENRQIHVPKMYSNKEHFFFFYKTKDNLSITENVNLAVINIIPIIINFFSIDTVYQHFLTINI